MKQALGVSASALLTAIAVAHPQYGPPGSGNWPTSAGPWSAFPTCAISCRPTSIDWTGPSLCGNADVLDQINTCVNGSSCSDADKSEVKEMIARLCANMGSTITEAAYATYSATSDGSAWPSAWTSNSAWPSAASSWGNGNITAAPGWHGGGYGPFSHGGPGSGWGPGTWTSSGNWTDGPWTNWWGTNKCPPATWTGWTEGSWSDSAPWTTWTACTAQTTTSVYTTTVTISGDVEASVGTVVGYGKVAEATAAVTTSSIVAGTSSTDSGAIPTSLGVAGSAMGVIGVLAGAILL